MSHPQSSEVVILLATASSEYTKSAIQYYKEKYIDVVLIINQNKQNEYHGISNKILTFDGTITPDSHQLGQIINNISPDHIIIAIGRHFFHQNIFKALFQWQQNQQIKKAQISAHFCTTANGQQSPLVLADQILLDNYEIDPTRSCPPGYRDVLRAQQIYGEAFRRCFEYLEGSAVNGHFAEFGVYKGFTARIIATMMSEFSREGSLWLYDSFEGFPESEYDIDKNSYEIAENKVWNPGIMKLPQGVEKQIHASLGQLIANDHIHIIKGFYSDTLPIHSNNKLALLHIDCDLYSSTKDVLEHVINKQLLQDGTIILMDDYNSNRANPNMGERKAIKEIFDQQNRYSYSAWFSYGWHGQSFFVHGN